METLKEDTEEYFQWLKDIDTRKEQLKGKSKKLSERLEKLRQKDVKQLEADRQAVFRTE